jgi:hypothetical protein
MMATRWWPLGSGAASLRISVPRRRSRRNQATSVTTKYHLSILHVHHQQISLFPCNRRNSPRSISSSIADYCLWISRRSLWRVVSCSVPIGITSIPAHAYHHQSWVWDQSEKSGNGSYTSRRWNLSACCFINLAQGSSIQIYNQAKEATRSPRPCELISEKFIVEASTWLHVHATRRQQKQCIVWRQFHAQLRRHDHDDDFDYSACSGARV